MGNFNRGNRSGGDQSFSRRTFAGRGSDRSSMYKTTCSKCGNECEVPFKPSGGRPVFCSKCFESKGAADSRRYGGRDSGRSRFDDKRMYKAVCDKCGSDCNVPFQPTSGKPVYCSKCFEGKNDRGGRNTEQYRGGRNTEQYKEQFEALNAKLDKILKMLTPVVSTKVAQEEEIVKEIKVPKPKKQVNKTKKKKTVAKKPASTKKE